MSFLDDLLTFEKPLSEGVELKRTAPLPKKSLLEKTGLKKRKKAVWEREIFKYHKTKAGLYVVLCHDEEGKLIDKSDCPGTVSPYLRTLEEILPEEFIWYACSWQKERGITSLVHKNGCAIRYLIKDEKILSLDLQEQNQFHFKIIKNGAEIRSSLELPLSLDFDEAGKLADKTSFINYPYLEIDYEATLRKLVDLIKQPFTFDENKEKWDLNHLVFKQPHPYR